MRFNKTILIFCVFLTLICLSGFCQQDLSLQLPKVTTYSAKDVVDEEKGISLYEPLNQRLSLDSIRHCKGYACNGVIIDYYDNGEILHKGYYMEGQLTSYTNYYPGGQIERTFVSTSVNESEMMLYYSDGTIKSSQKYFNFQPTLWKDYYPNGELGYHMIYDLAIGAPIVKREYNKYGILTSEMYLSNKKKNLFRQNIYYETGVPITKGELTFDGHLHTHIKNGKWLHFYPNGKISKVEVFEDNQLISSKEKADI